MNNPSRQIVRVAPAVESERIGTRSHSHSYVPGYGTAYGSKKIPVRCQIWDGSANEGGRLVHMVPLRMNEEGHIDDLHFTAGEAVRFDRLVFVWGKRVFAFKLPERQLLKAGQTARFALGHLKLVDKFGSRVLGAGHRI